MVGPALDLSFGNTLVDQNEEDRNVVTNLIDTDGRGAEFCALSECVGSLRSGGLWKGPMDGGRDPSKPRQSLAFARARSQAPL